MFSIHFHQLLSHWVVISIDDAASPFAVNLLFSETDLNKLIGFEATLVCLCTPNVQHDTPI